jgi:hypothetical protein
LSFAVERYRIIVFRPVKHPLIYAGHNHPCSR